jgi:hypothetical protein
VGVILLKLESSAEKKTSDFWPLQRSNRMLPMAPHAPSLLLLLLQQHRGKARAQNRPNQHYLVLLPIFEI